MKIKRILQYLNLSVFSFFIISCESEEYLPIVETITPVTNITATTAVAGGNVINDNGFTVIERGVCWSELPDPTLSDSITIDGSGAGSYVSYVKNLKPNTSYYVRAYAKNKNGLSFGNTLNFKTLDGSMSVLTSSIDSIYAKSVVVTGLVLESKGFDVIERGFCYGLKTNPTLLDSIIQNGDSLGFFSSKIIGLNQNTTYFIRAYAKNELGITYGNEIVFTTRDGIISITTESAKDVTNNSARIDVEISDDGGSLISEKGVCVSTNNNPTIKDMKVVSNFNNKLFSILLNELLPSTIYYVRAYAINEIGICYSSEKSFNTLEPPITGISISPTILSFTEEGQTDILTATLEPAEAKRSIVWASSNTAVATVSGNGHTAVVTAVGNGTAKITATADIFRAECTVTVHIDNGEGDGTEESPYNVVRAIQNQGSLKWVQGYIVGYVNGLGIVDAAFGVPTEAQSEILIAASATETNAANCLPVQLPSGAIRTGLELFANPTNLGKSVKLYGSLEAYFGQPGLKSTTYFEIEGGATGGIKPVDPTGALLYETLLTETSYNKFIAYSVTGDQVWTLSTNYGAVISGYSNGTFYANEDWLISPTINLTGKTNAKLSFEHARGPASSINIGVTEGYYTVWVSNNYNSGAPSTANWTEIKGVTHGTTAWGYVFSGQLTIPTANLAPNARIAFKYLSINGASATWEIKNVLVK